MGCGIHAILQKLDKNGTWKTIQTDAINLGSSSARAFSRATSEFATEGLPRDLKTIEKLETDLWTGDVGITPNYVEGPTGEEYWLGEHSFSYFTIEEMLNAETSAEDNRVSFYTDEDGDLHITVSPITSAFDGTGDQIVNTLQRAYAIQIPFLEQSTHRLVIGYDS